MADENSSGPEPSPGPATTNGLLTGLREHRVYRVALGYAVGAWIILQVAAIVLPGFAAPPWALRGLMIVLALGFGAVLLAGWGYDRRASGRPLVPRAPHGRLGWVMTAILPAALVTVFFLLHPLERPSAARPAEPTSAPKADPVAPDKSVAVLPFENLSADKDNAFFADGVQDEVLTDLCKVADLKVISRTSVMQYRDPGRNLREIGHALDVAFVVEGSVQRAGNRIRVTAQLIDARTDAHRWAEHYDKDLSDVFAIQSEIAQSIAGQLQAAISPQTHAAMTEAPTHDLQAYELYLRAKGMFNSSPGDDIRAWFAQVMGLLTEATRHDPDFARAYAFLSEIQGLAHDFDPTLAPLASIRNEVATVARLRPGSADAHEAMGSFAWLIEHDNARAHDELVQAVRLAPNNANAFSLLARTDRCLGLWDDAIAHFRKAAELDPEDALTLFDHSQTLEALRRYPEAIAVLDHLAAAHPRDAKLLLDVQKFKAPVLLDWKADPRGALVGLSTLPPSYDPNGSVTALRLLLDHCVRDFAAADRTLAACPSPRIFGAPHALWEFRNAWYRGDKAAAQKISSTARPLLEAEVNGAPDQTDYLLDLAWFDAALGRKAEALSEARRVAAMYPLDRDAWYGPDRAGQLAVVLALTGEREEAIRLVQTLCAHPNGPSYGYLKLHPDWDALRGDPRFEAAVASLAPKP